MPLEWVSPYLVAGTALIFIMGNLADAKVPLVKSDALVDPASSKDTFVPSVLRNLPLLPD